VAKAPEKRPDTSNAAVTRVLPMQLKQGDRLTDETGEYEVIGRPYRTNAGKDVRVKRVDNAHGSGAGARERSRREADSSAEEGHVMMRLRRASVIAALSMLLSVATAHAECAWVFVGLGSAHTASSG
jgi:hypothetical protein